MLPGGRFEAKSYLLEVPGGDFGRFVFGSKNVKKHQHFGLKRALLGAFWGSFWRLFGDFFGARFRRRFGTAFGVVLGRF